MSWLRPKPKKEGSNVGIEKGFSNLSVKDNKEDVTTNAKINERATGTEYQNKTAHSTERENLGEVENLHKEKKLVQGLQKKTQPQQHFQEQFQQQRQFQQQPRQQPQRQQYYQSVNANANVGRTGHVAGNTGGGNGKAGVLVVKVLNGRGVMPLSKAQSIASSYSSYKNEVQQRPYAIISFDANEVIAAPVGGDMLNPIWGYRASFDVCRRSEVIISLYQQIEKYVEGSDKKITTAIFLGRVKLVPEFVDGKFVDEWVSLSVSGHIHINYCFNRSVSGRPINIDDFELLKVIGKGSFGKVMQVRKRDTGRIYAMKIISKSKIVMRSEVAHTLAERNVLAKINHPFIVPLKFSFQTKEKLYFVLAFINGGELFHHLQVEGRFDQHRSRFYAAELLCALECLHSYDVIYRDLKPENILIDYTGHILLCDFGLCKLNMTDEKKTNTFCGTPEYLAPELLLGKGYTRTVDWWTFGVLLYEMLTGLPPFYSENINEMYHRVLQDELVFPEDVVGSRARSLLRGLLTRDPTKRLGNKGSGEIKAMPFFAEIDWDLLLGRKYEPPFRPSVKSAFDTSNFDETFTAELPMDSYIPDSNLSDTVQQQFMGFTYDGGGGGPMSYGPNN